MPPLPDVGSAVRSVHRFRSAFVVVLLTAVACGDPMDPVSPAVSEGTGPSFASGGTVQYSLKRLPRLPGGGPAAARDINDAGVVAGLAASNQGPADHAVMWKGGVIADLGVPGGDVQFGGEPDSSYVGSQAFGIGASGVIVGAVYRSNLGPTMPLRYGAFRWKPSTGATLLPGLAALPGADSLHTIAFAVNGQGTAVGYSTTVTKRPHAVKWDLKGAIVDIHPAGALSSQARDINEDGWIAGFVDDGVRVVAALWPPDGHAILLGGARDPSAVGYGINDSEQLVGYTTSGVTPVSWLPPGYLLTLVMHPCGTVPERYGLEVSNLLRFVGWCRTSSGDVMAWTSRNGTAQLLPSFGPSVDLSAWAVNSCGTVVGRDNSDAAVWTRIQTGGGSGAPVCDQ